MILLKKNLPQNSALLGRSIIGRPEITPKCSSVGKKIIDLKLCFLNL